MSDVVLVLGMHRSGTSAVSGTLIKLGCGEPKTVMPANSDNARGYFESYPFMKLHDELLASAGSSWRDWRSFNPDWYRSPAAIAFKRRARDTFAEEFNGSPLAILKDPRMCRFTPFWLDVLREMDATPHIVMPIRSPLDVARSLAPLYGFSITQGMLLWLRYVLEAEVESRREARSIFSWRDFQADWRSVCNKIAADTQLSWPRMSDCASREIERFLTKDLVHHDTDNSSLGAHADVHEWTLRAYEALLILGHDPHSNSALTTLDDVRGLLNQSSKIFGRVLVDCEVDLEEAREQANSAVREKDAHHNREREILVELSACKESLGLALSQLGSLREQLDEKTSALERERQEAVDKKRSLAAALASALAESEGRAKEVAALTSALAESEGRAKEVAALTSALAESEGRAKEAECQNQALNQKLADSSAEQTNVIRELNNIAESLRARLVDVEAALATTKAKALRKGVGAFLGSAAAARRKVAKRLLKSGLFDFEFYRGQCPGARSALDAAEHYVEEGCTSGRRPNALFDTHWYLDRYEDVRRSGFNPLLHYLLHGVKEGRDPGPNFQTTYYFEANPDVRAEDINPLTHYLRHGLQEGRLATRPT